MNVIKKFADNLGMPVVNLNITMCLFVFAPENQLLIAEFGLVSRPSLHGLKSPFAFRPLNSQIFEPVPSQYPCDALTNCVMKPLTLGAGHLWVLRSQ